MPSTRLTYILNKHAGLFLAAFIGLFILLIFSVLVVKFNNFGYNAIDLGIYNQVFYNSSQGRLFDLSIHPHSYLGDHFELLIIFLLQVYKIFSTPLALLFLQTLFIALSAWPLYLLAKINLPKAWSLGLAVGFLINPVVLNMAFFEFHLLPFAMFLLLFAFYFFKKQKITPYLIFIALALTVREDVSLIILMMGIFALIEKRRWLWSIVPFAIGGSWFIAALHLTGYFSGYGQYKFLAFYGWLGSSFQEMLTNFFSQPWLVVQHFFSTNNLISALALLVPLAGLPLLKPKYLWPLLLVGGQLSLLSGGPEIILRTHYAALLLPFFYVAGAAALADWQQKKIPKNAVKSFIFRHFKVYAIILVAAVIYSFFTLSPVLASFKYLADKNKNANTNLRWDVTAMINTDDAVVSSYGYLPVLSQRQELHSLHYIFRGKLQYSNADYPSPTNITKLAVDFNDFLVYAVQGKDLSPTYKQGAARVSKLINDNDLGLTSIADDQALFVRGATVQQTLVDFSPAIMTEPGDTAGISDELMFLGWGKSEPPDNPRLLPLAIYWATEKEMADDLQIEIQITDADGQAIYKKIFPLGYGIWPTSTWPAPGVVKTNYWLLLPELYSGQNLSVSLQVLKINGYLTLNSLGSAYINYSGNQKIGNMVTFTYNTR